MGFIFRKRIGLGPLNLNLSKSGVGFSLGVRGFRTGISSSGRHYVSAGLPGTGLVYRQFARKQRNPATRPAEVPPLHPVSVHAITPKYPIVHPHSIGYGLGYIVGWLLILSPIVLLVLLILRLAR